MTTLDTTSPSVGMVKDTSPLSQKEGTYTYALNAVLESSTGDVPFISNEMGTKFSTFLPENSTIIGRVLTNTNTFILFLAATGTSYIVEYFPDTDTYTIILETTSLNFKTAYPVKALFRIFKGCERLVYFTDNYNPYRVLNLDNPDINGPASDANNLNFTRNFEIPNVEPTTIQDYGGNLEVGTYSFFIQLLDSDLNATGWVDETPTIPIVDEPYSSGYNNIDGGVSDANALGAVPVTNKSIVLTITNLDTTFSYYRIAVVASNSGTGEVSGVYYIDPVQITSPTSTLTIRDLTAQNVTLGSLDEIQAAYFPIHVVGSHAQIDNRLVLADLKGDSLDYGVIQQATQLISVSWGEKWIRKESNRQGVKGLEYYRDFKSFLRDEVYALAIYGKKLNGERTPAFHIPGRESISTDLDLITIIPDGTPRGTDEINEADVLHLNLSSGDTVERWKVFNTAESDKMSYWESSIDYPDTVDCNNNRIYPTGKIRHHKFPDTRLSPIEQTAHIVSLGLNIDLTDFLLALPSEINSAIDEWVVCRADRTDENKTILDKGYVIPARSNNDTPEKLFADINQDLPPSGTPVFNNFYQYVLSPKSLFFQQPFTAEYLSVENQMDLLPEPVTNIPLVSKFFLNWTTHIDNTTLFNRVLTGYSYIDRYRERDGQEAPSQSPPGFGSYPWVEQNLNGTIVSNFSHTTDQLAIHLASEYEWNRNISPFQWKFSYCAFKNNNSAVYSSLNNLTYLPLKKTDGYYFGGDIFIDRMTNKFTGEGFVLTGISAYYESEINVELRHNGLAEPITQEYFKGDIFSDAFEEYCRGYYPADDTYYFRPEFVAYNKDYTKYQKEVIILPPTLTYNWCGDCEYRYPFRIIASEKSFQSNIQDNYRIFLANNRMDIDGDCGGIEDLVVNNDNLYCLTYNYPVFIPVKPQTLQTNENLTYVGTGEIFSIPYKKINNSNYPYGGCKDWMSIISTEYGVMYADSNNGKMHLLTSPLEDISMGLSNWLEENMQSKLEVQLKRLTGNYYPTLKYPTNGHGFTSGYDPRHKRILFTKRDMEILDETKWGGEHVFSDTVGTELNKIYLDPELGIFFIRLGSQHLKLSGDSSLFRNYSWTLSFSPRHRAWVSYHSYLPYTYFNDGNITYSSIPSIISIHKHNGTNFQTYHSGQKKKHTLEFVLNKDANLVKTFSSLEIVANSSLNNIDSDVIFDRIWAYNSYQSSGFKNLVLKSNRFQTDAPAGSIFIDKIQRTWRLNELRDYLLPNTTMFSTNWTDISSDYYVDKVPINIDNARTLFDLPRFRDRFLQVRLEFKPTTNNKLVTNILTTQQNISYR